MELLWMGRYQKLLAALVSHTNYISRTTGTKKDRGNGVMLSSQEIQVLEVLLKNEDKMLIMSDISGLLGILPSLLSQITKQLLKYDLVECYRIEGNRKNIILKPSQKGRELYMAYCSKTSKIFATFFAHLESLTDEQISAVADAINALNQEIGHDQETLLK